MWSDDPDQLATLARWLTEQGITETWEPGDWAHYMEHGHRWTQEWNDMQAELLEERYAA